MLEWYDAVWADDTILQKKRAFEADVRRSQGVSYTTVSRKSGWSAPLERARLAKAASPSAEQCQSLLRIDKDSRKNGQYHDMETELFCLFKERRARGRKVSARWLTATSRKLMQVMHPEKASA